MLVIRVEVGLLGVDLLEVLVAVPEIVISDAGSGQGEGGQGGVAAIGQSDGSVEVLASIRVKGGVGEILVGVPVSSGSIRGGAWAGSCAHPLGGHISQVTLNFSDIIEDLLLVGVPVGGVESALAVAVDVLDVHATD